MNNWTRKNIPPQNGKTAVITGATGGLGLETALALADAGASVVLTGRNDVKGRHALERIRTIHSGALISYQTLDLARLANVAEFAEKFSASHDHLDVLVNNAGVMAPPARTTTPDGFERQFGVNYLSHFALTARLLPLLRQAEAPRVVNLSSGVHHMGAINFDNLQAERGYRPWKFYAQSKLAMLVFALELQRRSDANGWGLMSNAAHPGWATTELMANGPGSNSLTVRLSRLIAPIFAHSPADGALPQIFAATDPAARNGAYYGPTGLFELKGPVGKARIDAKARDLVVAKRLWQASEQLTGVSFGAETLGV